MAHEESKPGTVYESKADGLEDPASFTQMWIDQLRQAEEKDWLGQAENAIDVYRGKGQGGRTFNILHSNVETIGPAVYNSTPAPDVRRRYNDPDPISKTVADMIERSLSFSIDNYDFDTLAKSFIRDGELTGRGISRVKYVPVFGDPMTDPMTGEPVLDERGQPVRELLYESVQCDYVPWRYFRRGPARAWKDVRWVAFCEFLTKDDVAQINPDIAEEIDYNYSAEHANNKKTGTEEQTVFKRAPVWQIWDKEERIVITLCEDYGDAPISIERDPLGLSGFFPIPKPYQPITAPDSLVPVVPYEIYKDQVAELNQVTERIAKMIRSMRPRALYGGPDAGDIAKWASADDGELVAVTSAAMIEGDMQKLLAWFPLDPTIKALQVLVAHRNQIKQTIYEVSGLGDILRGATDPDETATAQRIKQQWGSLRIQDRQGEVARVIRELFRLKAEIICQKFSWETITAMTGIDPLPAAEKQMIEQQVQQQAAQIAQQVQMAQQQAQMTGQPPAPPPQPQPLPPELQKRMKMPTREEVEEVMRSDILRLYRIDVESDSTIRGDMSRNREQIQMFLEGTALFGKAMLPIAQVMPESTSVILEVFTAFARTVKLGKQAEDALDSLADKAKQTPPQKPPSPEQIKQKELEMQMQMEVKKEEARAGAEQQKAAAAAASEQQRAAVEQQKANDDRAFQAQKFQQEQQKANDERMFKREEHEFRREEQQWEREKHDREMQRMDKDALIRDRESKISLAAQGLKARQPKGSSGGEEEFVSGEDVRNEQSTAALGQLAQVMQQMAQQAAQSAQMQAQTSAAMTEALKGLTQAQLAPNEIVRDPRTGKAIGSQKKMPRLN